MEKIIRFFADNKLFVNLLIIFILVSGLLSLQGIRRESMPNVETDVMVITVIYPGASPVDVELNAVVPIEEELSNISGIDYYTSLSIENGASIFVEIEEDVEDKRRVKDEIFREIDKSSIEDIPDEVDEIIVTEIEPKIRPVYTFSVSQKKGSKVSERELHDFVDDLEKMLEKLSGVNDVTLSGYRDREVHIDVIPDRMKSLHVSLNEIVNSIKTRNVRSTGGSLQSLHREQNIVTIGQFEDPSEVGEVIIRSGFEQKRVRVKDVATVRDDFEEADVKIHVNAEKGMILAVNKKENADIISTVQGIKYFLSKNSELYKDRFDITVVDDRTEEIESLISVVLTNAIIGFVLVVIILFIFLDFRTSFWTAMGIPLSLFMVFTFMRTQDYTLNIMTLGAIITVLGMVVDHGIVIAEAIYENRSKGMSPLEATVQGIKSVFTPVTITILTTIVAFLPMLAIGGMMGKFIFIFPVIVVATLIASFFEATVILPGHLSNLKPGKKKKSDWFNPVKEFYGRLLEKVLRWRYPVAGGFVVLFLAAFTMCGEPIKNFVLMDDNTADIVYINLEAAKGTPLEVTERLTGQVEKLVMTHVSETDRVSVITSIGHHTVGHESLGNHENWSQVQINLVPVTERSRSADDVIEDLRSIINTDRLKDFKMVAFEKKGSGPPTGFAVNVRIIGSDMKASKRVQMKIENFLHSIKGVTDIDNDQKNGKEELKLVLDYDRLSQYGITVSDVASTIYTAYEGTIATYVQTTDQKIEYRVRVDDRFHRGRNFLLDLLVPNTEGRLIRVGDIARIKVQQGASLINHYNGDRSITITANVDSEVVTSAQVARMINEKFSWVPKKYPGTYILHGGETKRTSETMGGVRSAFLMAVLLIYFILILMFRSVTQPVMILLTIPFGMVGVLIAFSAHGMPLSFFAIIGIIGLSGVVINDSVIMVDFINRVFQTKQEDNSISTISLITEGAKQRLRPVLLTTLTTVAALMPTAYGIGGDAQMLVPAVMAMAYGLLFASLLTLLFIPALYLINRDIRVLLTRLAGMLPWKR